jgi:phage terminase large subunit-like protein
MFNKLKNLTDSFFDGLKTNAINKAVKSAEKNVRLVPTINQRMTELDKASKQLEDMLKEIDPDYESKED